MTDELNQEEQANWLARKHETEKRCSTSQESVSPAEAIRQIYSVKSI